MSICVRNLDHLGIVAGLIDEIGIVELLNELVGEHQGEKVSAGVVVKAMILNGLGLVSSPLYLFGQFFEGQATEHLLGDEIKSEYLNDDRLGRVLDRLYQTGLSQVFMSIMLAAVKKYALSVETVHLDTSSFHVHGEYQSHSVEDREEDALGRIDITYGYSRDHRPDLKQFTMGLMCSSDGDVPLWIKIGSGNEADPKQFAQILKEFKQQLHWESLVVLDSAFYNQENIQHSANVRWLSRVPQSIKAARSFFEGSFDCHGEIGVVYLNFWASAPTLVFNSPKILL